MFGTTGAWNGDKEGPGTLQGDAQEGPDENGRVTDLAWCGQRLTVNLISELSPLPRCVHCAHSEQRVLHTQLLDISSFVCQYYVCHGSPSLIRFKSEV